MLQLGRRLISSEPQPHRGELDHGEEVGGELVVAGSDAAEVLQLREKALDQVALAVEALARLLLGGMLGVAPWSWISSRMRSAS